MKQNETVHLLLADLENQKNDQVAAMLKHGMRGWLDTTEKWAEHTEGLYERYNKARTIDYAIFSNLGDVMGYPNKEEPFIQLEVDRHTKKGKPLDTLPFAYGVSDNLLNNPRLRDMVYPFLYILTVLTRQRRYLPIAIYPESHDRPLQIDLLGNQCIWRVMIWQNRLVREYNQAIGIDPSFAAVPDNIHELIDNAMVEHAQQELGTEIGLELDRVLQES